MTPTKKIIAAGFVGAITAAAAFIAPEEGISLKAYQDSVNVWTICRGHTGPEVKKGMVLDKAACDALFKTDIWKAMSVVLTNTNREIPQGMLVSMTSFTFNVGEGKFKSSTMLKKINRGDLAGACKELPRWKYAGGMDCSIRGNNCYGVWERRLREQTLCEDSLL